jgi:hypothetical protein
MKNKIDIKINSNYHLSHTDILHNYIIIEKAKQNKNYIQNKNIPKSLIFIFQFIY